MQRLSTERRREPRLMANLTVSVFGEDGEFFDLQTRAVDMSAHGAAVLMQRPVRLNTMVAVAVRRSGFRGWAVVRSNRTQRHTGRPVVGLEYVGGVQYPGLAGGTGRT
jgi:hypothetical protein